MDALIHVPLIEETKKPVDQPTSTELVLMDGSRWVLTVAKLGPEPTKVTPAKLAEALTRFMSL
jgi:hypothetical protein